MEKNTGIVLKKCMPKNNTAFLLDYKIGKIKCITNADCIITGSVINYFVKNNKNPYIIESIELLYVPFEIASTDLLFLHHVLEICDQFLPIQSQTIEIFELIKYLYTFEKEIKCKTKKKLFIFKLFTLLGIYPEDRKFQTPYFNNLATESIDKIISKNLDLECEQELNNWLHFCVARQSEFSSLKTINFLYKK